MLISKKAVIITDPCYLLNEKDWEESDFGEELYTFFPNSICRDTVYGDWTCTMYQHHGDLNDIDDVLSNVLHEIGTFTADAGMVCIITMEDVCKYGSRIFDECSTHCYTIIPGFKIKNIDWDFEFDEEGELHVVGRDENGFIRFISKQTDY